MVYLTMSMEIQLINQIEKFEFLYNFNLPEYNRKDLVDEAWANIAANTNLSISDCKEKWRNIRSSFLRSMKPSGSKVKKPYYLTEYLKFILPFLKPINLENIDDGQYDSQTNTSNEAEVVVDFIKVEPEEYGEHDGTSENPADNGILSDLLTRRSSMVRKRRRFVPAGKRNLTELMKSRGKVTSSRHDFAQSETPNSSNNGAMRMFLMSLLPELEAMTEDQIRMFKIKTMMLVDDIKLNYAEMRRNTSNINTERLQKRLINLLLKNLETAPKENYIFKTEESSI